MAKYFFSMAKHLSGDINRVDYILTSKVLKSKSLSIMQNNQWTNIFLLQ